ncbi:LytR C-terminal domain-containing protein [Brevibacterium sp.]|uniref:LytR C-terminal domain-containing protein n=1 Tax=Brevibacterium sp. TaxID=1701 RepID=UPI0028110306|nr:LytR C-terminal domain-containing protein [Brevibacterium sp.]
MNDEFDDVQPGRRSGAHRQEAAAKSNVGAIALVIVLALVAVLLVVAAINIITSSMRDPEADVAEPAPTTSAEATPSPTESEVSVVDASLKVDVLNASGVSGAASKFSKAVEKKGWEIGTVGNHSTDRTDSVVYYQDKSNAAQAQLVADSLGIETTEQSNEFSSDLSVVICSDIARRGPEPAAGAPSEGASNESGAEGGQAGLGG